MIMTRAGVVTILDNFQKIALLFGVERFGPPIVEDELLDARSSQEPVAPVAMGDRQIGEQPGHAE